MTDCHTPTNLGSWVTTVDFNGVGTTVASHNFNFSGIDTNTWSMPSPINCVMDKAIVMYTSNTATETATYRFGVKGRNDVSPILPPDHVDQSFSFVVPSFGQRRYEVLPLGLAVDEGRDWFVQANSYSASMTNLLIRVAIYFRAT